MPHNAHMDIRHTILRTIDAYLARSGISERAFGVAAVGDGKFVSRLRRGFGVTLTTIERAAAFMEEPDPPRPGGASMPVPRLVNENLADAVGGKSEAA